MGAWFLHTSPAHRTTLARRRMRSVIRPSSPQHRPSRCGRFARPFVALHADRTVPGTRRCNARAPPKSDCHPAITSTFQDRAVGPGHAHFTMEAICNMSTLIPLNEVRTVLSTPDRPSLPTIWHWCLKGVQGHRLEAHRVGRRWYTTEEAVLEFGRVLAETSRANLDRKHESGRIFSPHPKMRTEKQRARDIAAAEQSLREKGFFK